MPTNAEPAANRIALTGVSKHFDSQIVLDGADLTIAPGEFLAVMGRSGSGKSTLLKLIGGLDQPDSGQIRHGDQDLAKMNDRERTKFRRRSLGFVFQFFNLIPTLTVSENVAFPLALNKVPKHVVESRTLELFSELGLKDCAYRFPDELSGGEQQRVAIARALAHEPSLVIADEPTGNLDLETAHQVHELLRTTCGQRGTTLIVATHSQDVVALADRIIEIRDGRLEPT